MEAILLGTGVLMAMALVLDLLMGLAERYLNSRTGQRSRTSRLIARAASAAACVAAAALCVVAFFPSAPTVWSSTRANFPRCSWSTA